METEREERRRRENESKKEKTTMDRVRAVGGMEKREPENPNEDKNNFHHSGCWASSGPVCV